MRQLCNPKNLKWRHAVQVTCKTQRDNDYDDGDDDGDDDDDDADEVDGDEKLFNKLICARILIGYY